MFEQLWQTPLKTGLLDISPHNRAILEFFFAGAGKKIFKIVDNQMADVFIIDFDHPGARNNWEKVYARQGKPGIVLSIKTVELPFTVWVSKPLTTQALNNAARSVRKLINKNAKNGVETKKEIVKPTTTDITKPKIEMRFATVKKRLAFSFSAVGSRKSKSLPLKKFRQKKKSLVAEKELEEKMVSFSPNTKTKVNDETEEKVKSQQDKRRGHKIVGPTEADRKRWTQLCGTHKNIVNEEKWHLEAVLYTPENYFATTFQNAFSMAKQSNQMVEVTFNANKIILYPQQQQIYCNLDICSDHFVNFCNDPISTEQINIHLLDSTKLEQLIQQYFSDTDYMYDLEAFIWTLSLLTSSGRLHRKIQVHQKVALTHWPNFTRLELFPHAMKIAALWSHKPSNLFDIAKNLHIPQRYVFSFYNATNALGLIEYNQEKLKTKKQKGSKTRKKHRGLLARLFRRLLGGGGK